MQQKKLFSFPVHLSISFLFSKLLYFLYTKNYMHSVHRKKSSCQDFRPLIKNSNFWNESVQLEFFLFPLFLFCVISTKRVTTFYPFFRPFYLFTDIFLNKNLCPKLLTKFFSKTVLLYGFQNRIFSKHIYLWYSFFKVLKTWADLIRFF
jgi:hypothetical protein